MESPLVVNLHKGEQTLSQRLLDVVVESGVVLGHDGNQQAAEEDGGEHPFERAFHFDLMIIE